MKKNHSEHIGKAIAAGIRAIVDDMHDTIVVNAHVTLIDIDSHRLDVMVDGTYPQTRTLVRYDGEVIGSYLNYNPGS